MTAKATEPKKATTRKKTTKVDPTGFDVAGFRPVAGQIAVILLDEHIEDFEESEKEKSAKSNITINPKKKLFLGKEHEEKQKAKKEAARTYEVAAISLSVAANEDMPKVGDRIAFLNGTPVNEFIVNGKKYGLIPSHKVAGIFAPDSKITVSDD